MLIQVAFVPHPNGLDDTSYFVSRHSDSSSGTFEDQDCSDAASDTTEVFSDTKEVRLYNQNRVLGLQQLLITIKFVCLYSY